MDKSGSGLSPDHRKTLLIGSLVGGFIWMMVFNWTPTDGFTKGTLFMFYNQNVAVDSVTGEPKSIVYSILFVVLKIVDILSCGFGFTFFFIMMKESKKIIPKMKQKFIISSAITSILMGQKYPHEMAHFLLGRYMSMFSALLTAELMFHFPCCLMICYIANYQLRLYKGMCKKYTLAANSVSEKSMKIFQCVGTAVLFIVHGQGVGYAQRNRVYMMDVFCKVPDPGKPPGPVILGLITVALCESFVFCYSITFLVRMKQMAPYIPAAMKTKYNLLVISQFINMANFWPHGLIHIMIANMYPFCLGAAAQAAGTDHIWSVPLGVYIGFDFIFHYPVSFAGYILSAQMYELMKKAIEYSTSDLRKKDADDDSSTSSSSTSGSNSSTSGSSSSGSTSSSQTSGSTSTSSDSSTTTTSSMSAAVQD